MHAFLMWDDKMEKKEIIDLNEFARLDLRIGKIENAERIEGSKKLIKLDVDVGDEMRQLVAGIAEDYNPKDLISKLVPVLVNLKPAKLMGVESRGMILAVDVKGKPILLHPDKEVPAGSRVR
jgi:methionyl-tRNA synthetase